MDDLKLIDEFCIWSPECERTFMELMRAKRILVSKSPDPYETHIVRKLYKKDTNERPH